jgi:glucose-6-phosphate 1-dehydrogenase
VSLRALRCRRNGFDYSCSTQSPEAYETLVLDALLGDTLFMRSDQVEEAWDGNDHSGSLGKR